jgi:hypothetical protein
LLFQLYSVEWKNERRGEGKQFRISAFSCSYCVLYSLSHSLMLNCYKAQKCDGKSARHTQKGLRKFLLLSYFSLSNYPENIILNSDFSASKVME